MNRRLLWSLLLALLLPLAQLSAAAHEVSHLRTPAQEKSLPATHCDTCVAGAVLAAGGAAACAAVVLHAPAAHAAPETPSPAPHGAVPFPHFLSRAPPLSC